MSSKKKITLKSSDGKTFKVEETLALESQTIKQKVEDDCADTVIPLPNVTSAILSKVIEYCKKHVEARSGDKKDDKSTILRILSKVIGCRKKHVEDDLKTWDADFVKVDNNTLFDLILAAKELNIQSLLDLTAQTAADSSKTAKTFNLKELSPEEKEKVRRENPRAFE